MKDLHFCIGLPRSGSTVLMNILQQNPEVYTTGTCPMPYLFNSVKFQMNQVAEFIAMDQTVLTDGYKEFLRHGMEGWYTNLTEKTTVISKSRYWDENLNDLFAIYKSPKFIVCLRDIRDIICSFEKLLFTHTRLTIAGADGPFHLLPLDKRIELYCTDREANLGKPLHNLRHVYEWMLKRPECFYVFRFEDFNEDPNRSLRSVYDWLGRDQYEHNLSNIQPAAYYEHDTVYRHLVDHKTRPILEKLEQSYKTMLTEEQSEVIVKNNSWFYQTFYKDIFNNFQRTNYK
jgi:hypothetical protein